MITIKINEKPRPVGSNLKLMDLKTKVKPDADVIIYNGFPITQNIQLKNGDSVVLFKRGEHPSQEEIVAASGLAGYEDSNTIKTTRFSSRIFIVGDQKTAAQPGMGLMAPRVGIAAHHQANLVLRILIREEG